VLAAAGVGAGDSVEKRTHLSLRRGYGSRIVF
jgi:hypothetical protein